MTNETQAKAKGPSREQARILIAAGIVLILGGGMCSQNGDSQFLFGFVVFVAGAGVFLVGALRHDAWTRANQAPKEATELPAWKPALGMLLGGTALAIAAMFGILQQEPAWQDVLVIAFLIGTVVGVIGLQKLLKRLQRSITGK